MRHALARFTAGLGISAVLIVMTVLGPSRAGVSADSASSAPTQEIVTLVSGDGLQVPGILTWPAGAALPAGPVILHLPDGPGKSPLRAADTARHVAHGLARLGYPSLSIETRHTFSYPFGEFDSAFADVRAAIDMLAARGFASVVLAGDGLGSMLAMRYAAFARDGRVTAVIAFAPSPDLPDALRTRLGKTVYESKVAEAVRAVNEDTRGIFINAGEGLIFMPPAFLDWYGPKAGTALSAAIRHVKQPILLAAGGKDTTASTARMKQLAENAAAARSVTRKIYPGASHDFGGARAKLLVDTSQWLAAQSIQPPVQVTTKVVDVMAADGTQLAGILYAPISATPVSAKPAFMIVHGWTGDIMRSTPHWLATLLARRGYTVLAPRTRSSGFRATVQTRLEDIPQDIAAWTNFLASRGREEIVGVGQTTGGLWLSTYLAQSKDKRIKGVVYLGPNRDLPAYARRAMGEDAYARAVKEAQTP